MARRVIRLVNFARYNPPAREITSLARNGRTPLKWARWQADTHRDQDLLDLPPAERWVWPTLVGLACRGTPHGDVEMSDQQLAREAHLTETQVTHALRHLRQRGLVRFVTGSVTTP